MASRPKFYLRNKPSKDGKYQLILKYSFNGHRLEYYCGISVLFKDYNPEYWKSKKKPLKTTAYNAINFNNELAAIEADLLKLVSDARGPELNAKFIKEQLEQIYKPKPAEVSLESQKHETSFINYFEKALLESRSGRRVIEKTGKQYSLNQIKHYGVSLSAVKRFAKYKGLKNISFSEVNQDFYNEFRDFVFNVENKEKATFGGYIRDIKTIMNENNRSDQVKKFTKPTYEADTVYLTLDEINLIANLDFSDNTMFYRNSRNQNIYYHTLDKVRDLFLIGAYTGLRFSDFSNLDIKSIEGNFISLKQKKTGSRVTIPIMSKLKPVLTKYSKELPTISNQKFNDYIKHVAELAGLTELRTISNTKGNRNNTDSKPLYKLISSHCCRRSYATNMFKAGVPPMLIMSATGHNTETSFLKYIRANNDDKAKLLAETMKKLGL